MWDELTSTKLFLYRVESYDCSNTSPFRGLEHVTTILFLCCDLPLSR